MPKLDCTYYAVPVGPYCDITNRVMAAHLGGMAAIRVLDGYANYARLLAIPAFHYAAIVLDGEEKARQELMENLGQFIASVLDDDMPKH